MNRFKQLLALALLSASFGAFAQSAVVREITTQNTNAAGPATVGSCAPVDVRNKGSVSVRVAGTYTGALSGQVTVDGATWATLGPTPFAPFTATGTPTATISSGATGSWRVADIVGAASFRVCALAAVTGTAVVTMETSAAAPSGVTNVSGGAGDASAANQVAGNASLTSIDGKLPAQGQALAAASVPVVLTAAQVSTLTPPAAITGFATAAKQPALGTAGASSTDVISVQGIASGTAMPISGTVTANAGTNLNTANIESYTSRLLSSSVPTAGGAATSTTALAIGGRYNSTQPTLTTGQEAAAQLDASGNLRVNIMAGASSGAVAQGSTTSGQTGSLVQGAVTTSAPSYTTAQTSPLSLDTSGNLRVNVVTGGAGGGNVTGGTAHDAVGTAVNPVLIGAYASAAAPVAVSADGDAVRGWYTLSGAAAVQETHGGVIASAGAGAVGTGTRRVTLGSDDPAVAGLGGTSDAAATAGSTGSINAKLRLMTTQLATLDTSVNAANAQLPTTIGTQATASSLSTAHSTSDAGPVTAGTATATRGVVAVGVYNSTPPTVTNGQQVGMQVDANGYAKVNVAAGGMAVTNAGTFATQAAQSGTWTVQPGNTANTTAWKVDGSAVTQPVSGTVSITANSAVNVAQINGVAASMGNGVSGTGVQRVTLASDSTGVVGLATGSNTIGALTANQSVNVAQINGVTALMGAGNTGTGSARVTIATDQAAHATHGHGATGAAVPANATMAGGRSGANLISFPVSDTTAPITMSTATTTQMIALSGSTKTYIDNLSIIAAGTTNVTLVYGTGSNCVTSPSNLSGAYPLVANVGFVLQRIVVPAGQALCVTSSAAVQVSGHVTYTQFAP